jgi:hypothetical protein
MRTRVIPAQITTVEDKIVGSLNLMQIIMLMIPIFFMTLTYVVLPPSMSFVIYKLILFVLVLVLCVGLSLRIKGKVVVNWLEVLLSYKFRPKYHIYNKNETNLRTIYLPAIKKSLAIKRKTVKIKADNKSASSVDKIRNLISLEKIIGNQEVDFRYKVGRKGGLNVAFEQVKK